MIRSLALIVLAIQLSRPSIPKPEAERYAKVLQQEAKEHDFDPLTGVAIIHFESYWLPAVVSKDGEDYGLAQIRARYVRGCREDADPVNEPSEACVAAKARLLDGESNIRRMAALITANRELCEKKRGRVLFHEWLASYQGRNRPASDHWCVPGEGTWRVVNYRKELLAKLLPAPRARARSKATAASKADAASKASAKQTSEASAPSKAKSSDGKRASAAKQSKQAKSPSKASDGKRASAAKQSKQAKSPSKASDSKQAGADKQSKAAASSKAKSDDRKQSRADERSKQSSDDQKSKKAKAPNKNDSKQG